ncbi:MAG: alpha/beta hydrolase [Verrucomicrobiales bacterium]|nr:alpha/beta hydrolase [Verrucomicrobiales bacterium]
MRAIPYFLALFPLLAQAGTVKTDVAYGDHPLQKLDVYLPDSPAKAPVMVYIHGGGWAKGDKAAVGLKPASFNGKGWIFVSVNYRLLPEGKHPANVNDVAIALAKIHDEVAGHGGDPERIFVMGHSAGAHLAALVATNPKPLEKAGKSLKILKGVISLDTNAYDLPTLVGTAMKPFYDSVFGTDPELLKDASPQLHVAAGKGIPPFLICYSRGMGRKAEPVRSGAAETFHAALAKEGIPSSIIDASDRNHGEINQWFGREDDLKVTAKAWEFLDPLAKAE